MSHKMFANVIVPCVLSGESDSCTSNDCLMFQKCYPNAFAAWQKELKKDTERESTSVANH